jgi:hypothetical protein
MIKMLHPVASDGTKEVQHATIQYKNKNYSLIFQHLARLCDAENLGGASFALAP